MIGRSAQRDGRPLMAARTPPTGLARGQRLRSLVRDLSGRTDREMVRLLTAQVDAALVGCRLAAAMVAAPEEAPHLRTEMTLAEHRGDSARAEVVLAMERSVVSPIDREDLFRLSRSIDDILDTLRDMVRLADLLELEDRTGLRALAEPLVDDLAGGLVLLGDAIQSLVDDPRKVAMQALAAKKNGLGRRYLEGVAVLLNGPATAESRKHL